MEKTGKSCSCESKQSWYVVDSGERRTILLKSEMDTIFRFHSKQEDFNLKTIFKGTPWWPSTWGMRASPSPWFKTFFWIQTFFVSRIFWVSKSCWSKTCFLVKKSFWENFFWIEFFLLSKKFCQKFFQFKKFLDWELFLAPEIFLSQQY